MNGVSFPDVSITVQKGDALSFEADVLVLKYADTVHGLDREVFLQLSEARRDIEDFAPAEGESVLIPARGVISATEILVLGVGSLRSFGYQEIRDFGKRALATLAESRPATTSVALTLHGPGYGLDEREAFESEIAGLLDAIHGGLFPKALQQVTIVELNAKRAARLAMLLGELLFSKPRAAAETFAPPGLELPARLKSVGYDSQAKPHIFVAMPFAEEMDDVFHYGINSAVNAAGFLCERADLSTFTGDVIDWVKKRISSASLVIADLSNANPNVYLEVGYAWGCGRPTVLIVRDPPNVPFDVRGQRYLVYKKIQELETKLRAELEGLAAAGSSRHG
ncbi:MAG: M17 family peptidase N-terminal domain-containing protein [Gammaproteobacteria bacterium]